MRCSEPLWGRDICQVVKSRPCRSASPSPQVVAAEALFHQAVATAQRHQGEAWELRATMSLTRLWQRQGRQEAAHGLLAPLYSTYTERLSTPDLLDAKRSCRA